MAESMVERVARALYEAQTGPSLPFEIINPEKYERLARTAIAAMREPTPKMLQAACSAMSPGKRPTQRHVSVKAKHGIRYRAMIDAALKEGE